MFNNNTKLLSIFFLLISILISKTFAQNQQQSHVHGISNINVAFANNMLQIQLNAPLMDIVGFEGKPKTVKQEIALELASEKLTDWKAIFQFYEGFCEGKNISIKKNDKKHHEHEHKHERENHSIRDYSHSEIEVLYEFNCANSKKLSSVKIRLFEIFSRIKKINARWISDTGQGQKFLYDKNNTLTFR